MMFDNPVSSWRSLLYVPAHVSKYVDSAIRSGADAVVLDLEDGVPSGAKQDARAGIRDAAEKVARAGIDVVVRINRPLGLAVRDIERSVGRFVAALALPKVESAEQVRLLAEVITETEAGLGLPSGRTRIITLVETADAWFGMRAIATADARVSAMLLGGEDLASQVGMEPSAENLLSLKQTMIMASAAARIVPLGLVGSFANFRDLDAFRTMVHRSRSLGFQGSTCIHPTQVAILNEVFTPSQAECEEAIAIVNAFEQSQSAGFAVAGNGGAMVDLPVAERARQLIRRHERIIAKRQERGFG
ncbi:CoA ester lyase [Sphingobium sp. V4]|uniref:HpcH/HpaI aldolase/citrate lyase family protein n=1 Tax=Sphingobium sp. V4 TaxID=3038927 RepID=UPI002557DEA6|nr:CoA ester lyase [Sphingobium sp. V4]WIW89488.1 CoA ester lyase [Sphingobium sp. V4]